MDRCFVFFQYQTTYNTSQHDRLLALYILGGAARHGPSGMVDTPKLNKFIHDMLMVCVAYPHSPLHITMYRVVCDAEAKTRALAKCPAHVSACLPALFVVDSVMVRSFF